MDWYKLEKKEVLEKLDTTPAGLSGTQVQEYLQEHGPNKIRTTKNITFLHFLLGQFSSFLTWLLITIGLFALVAARVFEAHEHYFDAAIIFVILVITSVLGAYQDHRSHRQAKNLERLHVTTCKVKRDGKTLQLPSTDIVPGDIILLSEGDRVPADARILSANSLEVDESLLTGESLPVAKKHTTFKESVPVEAQTNMLFMNTYVRMGTATAIVVATGNDTEMGKIAGLLEKGKRSPFIKELDKATNKITLIALGLIMLVVVMFMSKGMGWSSTLLLATALIIGAIPESLPAIVTFSITAGAVTLAKKNVLSKKNTQIETLGSIDVVCVDKTGTLTENRLSVKRLCIGTKSTTYDKLSDALAQHVAGAALLANASQASEQGFVGDEIDIAMIDYFNEQGFDLIKYYDERPRDGLSPFDTQTRTISSQHVIKGRKTTYTKGAPEHLLAHCDKIFEGDKPVKLTQQRKEAVEQVIASYAKESLRVIGMSYKQGKSHIFIGLIGLYDPPKPHLSSVINTLYEAGIEIKMITGDGQHTALAVAQATGFRNPNAIDWFEMRDLSAEKLKEVVESHNIFARVSPENKLAIVKALQGNNHRVAITGDGVNDVPALEEATVGIAMGKHSSDMAKNAADLIILDDNLEAIVEGVKQGRTIFTNIRKVINYLLTANLGEIMVMFIGGFFGTMPFQPIQLLWVNFAANYAPAMALGIDPPAPGIMRKKPTGTHEHFITKRLMALSVYISIKKMILLTALFYGTLLSTGNLVLAQTMAFTWLVLWHLVRIITMRMEEHVKLWNNSLLVASLSLPILAQLFILYTPANVYFRVLPLGLVQWGALVCFMVISIYAERVISYYVKKHIREDVDGY